MTHPTATTELQRDFRSRDELIAYLRTEFPAAAVVNGHVAATRGGRDAALARVAQVDPLRYAKTRNALQGAVTQLSPYLRHGLISLDEVRAAAWAQVRMRQDAGKLINELGWRDYFQRVYATIGDGVWQNLEVYKTGWRHNDYLAELPDDLVAGATGLACMDAFVHDLYTTGYLHNHARMWTAAYVVHWRRVQWQAGAAWFLTHLLDGDPASNNLSWQWVASTFSHKPYVFNRENLERNTGGVYCRACPLRRACPLDATYEQLEQTLFPKRNTPEDGARAASPGATVQKLANVVMPVPSRVPVDNDPRAGDVWAMSAGGQAREPAVIWLHGDALRTQHPAFAAAPGVPALFVWDDDLLTRWRISLKRIVFLYETLVEMAQAYDPLVIQRGDVAAAVAKFAAVQGAQTIVTAASPSPRFAAVVAKLRQSHQVVVLTEPPLVVPEGPLDLRRFSRYWQHVQPLVGAAPATGPRINLP